MADAYLHDPDVINEMAKKDPPKGGTPSLFGWTPVISALKDIHDQLIASKGGTKFVPRPAIPAYRERQRRKDTKLTSTVSRITGSD